jgi:hypothetical protein
MAAFQWPVSKLEIINSALSQCGDNLVNVADDGSDEWNTASPGYERALPYVIESHDWSWTTDVRTLQASPTPPDDESFDTAYALPDDLVHLILVRINGRNCIWELLNDQLVVNTGGASVGAALTIKGIFSTNSDPTFATPTVVLVLQAMVMSAIYRGLHEDVGQAERMWNAGKALLAEAKSRHDMQKPKRAMFNSRITASRRIRRPWPPTPGGWGGGGTPG